ncbi:MAG: class I SAM-dependent methyltransferase [Syntrophotaleaceae bacterium]
MDREKRDFDKEASAWDENPRRVKMAKDIAAAISEEIRLTPDMDVLDFGCGTGLLALELLPLVRSVVGVDSSQGMLDIFRQKIAEGRLNNVRVMEIDFERGDGLQGRYDLAVSSMTLHHIPEIASLLRHIRNVLKPGGYLSVADLDLEEGKFHTDNTGVFHFGFCREELRQLFFEAGFEDIRARNAAVVIKQGADGEMKQFGIFLMTGRKGKARTTRSGAR